jgi:hypothetical protein
MSEVEQRWPRRPAIERFAEGDAVFVRGVLDERGGLSTLQGEAYVSVTVQSAAGMRECGSKPLSAVTRADAYAPADELRYTRDALERRQADLTAIREALKLADPLPAIQAILVDPEPDEDQA